MMVVFKDRVESANSAQWSVACALVLSMRPSMKLVICCVYGMTRVKVFSSQWSWDLHRDFLSGQASN